ncbi:MAG TPA: acetylornithine transaminase [Candidatus Binataceae bacterium]|jgi:predicted acetylornithine/succinylornithine family transaminase|nr:acetylornithine transaminase [Candidatus Binataceae bacterium]
MNNAEIVELAHQNLINTYGCVPLAFVRATGAYLYDADGNRYLDFFCGLAVNNLGHGNPRVVRAIKEQAEKVTHVSNVFHTEPMARLAARLCAHFGDGRVFFCNSGAEANEAALKLARRWGHDRGGGRFEVISTLGSFHGRTFGTLSATGQEKYHIGFQPLVPGFRLVPYDDAGAIEKSVHDETVAILVEPIQGEGGVVMPHGDYLKRLRDLCDRRRLLLIFDEVQTGMGRTGRLFAWQHAGVKPDIMTLAKALGGGLPIGAAIAKAEIAQSFTPGSHGSTFGGNPVSCAAALAVLDALEQDGVLENATQVGAYMLERLRKFGKGCSRVKEVRGLGMMIGIVLKGEAKSAADACIRQRLLVNATADNVLRLLPPLTLTRDEAEAGLAIIERALSAGTTAAG